MENSFNKVVNNRNAVLLSVLAFLVCLGFTAWQWTLWDGAIANDGQKYRTALKFDKSNATEFPYSIKTQQGNLYARGDITTTEELLRDDNIDGAWLAIKKNHEEYRPHIETYSCNCTTDSKGRTSCQTCTRTVWEWEFDRSEERAVGSVKLLSQEFPAGALSWKDYKTQKIKPDKRQKSWLGEDDHHIKVDDRHRYYYQTVSDNLPYEGGFVSDHKGIRADDSIRPPSGVLAISRVLLTVLLVVASGVAGYLVFIAGYEPRGRRDEYVN